MVVQFDIQTIEKLIIDKEGAIYEIVPSDNETALSYVLDTDEKIKRDSNCKTLYYEMVYFGINPYIMPSEKMIDKLLELE